MEMCFPFCPHVIILYILNLEGESMFKRLSLFFLVGIIFFTACSKPASGNFSAQFMETALEHKQEIPYDFFPRTYTITSIGDSLTEGVGDNTNQGGYIPYLKKQLEKEKGIKEVTFYNYGVRGYRTPKLLKRIDVPKVKRAISKSDLVIITTGGNDLMRVVKTHISHLTLEEFREQQGVFEENLRSLVEKIRYINPHISICLIGLYNPFYKVFSQIQELDEVVSEWNIASQNVLLDYENTYFVDIADIFKDSEENLLYSDYFHPNNKGYEHMAKETFSVLINNHAFDKITEIKLSAQKRESDGENE